MDSSGIDAKTIQIARPRITVTRHRDGALEALGVRLLPTTAPATPAAPVAVTGSATAPAPDAVASSPSITARLGELHVEGAQVQWNDQAASKPVQITALADAQLTGLTVGKPAPPATFHATVSADGTLGEAAIDGSIAPDPDLPGCGHRSAREACEPERWRRICLQAWSCPRPTAD
jgi:hypothetical protein